MQNELVNTNLAVVNCGRDVSIGRNCVIGAPREERQPKAQQYETVLDPVTLGDGSLIANAVIIGEGCTIGKLCVIEDNSRLGYGCEIGDKTRLMYGAHICDRVVIESRSRIAGFLCDAAHVGEESTVMGSLVHRYAEAHLDWWSTDEPSPRVKEKCVIGYGSIVVGDVDIGPFSYIAAGALVTKSVPPFHIATRYNNFTHYSRWLGRPLQKLFEHWKGIEER